MRLQPVLFLVTSEWIHFLLCYNLFLKVGGINNVKRKGQAIPVAGP
jgi:hypothetical protein